MRLFLVAFQLSIVLVVLNVQSALATSPPTISPAAGLYFPGPSVTISAGGGSTIFYTLDGSVPSVSSQVYGSAIPINATTTINAIAVSGGVPSTVTTSVITVDPTINPVRLGAANAPTFLWFRSDVGVTSSTGTVSNWADQSGNGSDASQPTGGNRPAITSDDYNGYSSITMATSKYFDLPSGFANISNPVFYFATKPASSSNGYLIDLGNGSSSNNIIASAAAPATTLTVIGIATPSSMTASSGFTTGKYQALSMTRSAIDFQPHIYIDGLKLTTSGTPNVPNNVTRSQNHIGTDSSASANFYDGKLLEIIAIKGTANGLSNTQVDSYLAARYQFATQVPLEPVISVATGTLPGPTQVAIAVPADCTVRYTLDGTTPSLVSPLYSGPINIYYSQTLKAIAIKNDQTSSVASEAYTLDSNQWPAPDPLDATPLQVNVQSPAN